MCNEYDCCCLSLFHYTSHEEKEETLIDTYHHAPFTNTIIPDSYTPSSHKLLYN